jgi:hypothetical protein
MKKAIKLLKGHIANLEGDVIAMQLKQSSTILKTNKVTIELTVNYYNRQIEQHKEAIAELER